MRAWWLGLGLMAALAVTAAGQTTYRPRLSTVGTGVGGGGTGVAPSVAITSGCPSGVVSVSSTPVVIALTTSLDTTALSCVNGAGGACTIPSGGGVGGGDTTSSTVVSAGSNTITFTATDAEKLTGTAQCVVTYTSPDSVAPTVSSPTDISTGITPQSVAWTVSDNIGVTSATWRLSGGSETACSLNGAHTLATCSIGPLTAGAQVYIFKAYDQAANYTEDSITITFTVDTSNPVVTLDDASTVVTNTRSITVSGQATDAGGVTRMKVCPSEVAVWCTYSGGANPVSFTGTTTAVFSKFFYLNEGTHSYCFRAWDAQTPHSSHYGEACKTITYTDLVVEVITMGAPPGRTNTAYTAYDFHASGGDHVYTFTSGAGTSSFADADCAGLSIATTTDSAGFRVGRVSGTPSGSGTCTLDVKATDGTPTASATRSVNIEIGAGALEGPHDSFVTRAALAEVYPTTAECGTGACSLRDQSQIILLGGTSPTWVASTDYVTQTNTLLEHKVSNAEQLFIRDLNQSSGDFIFMWDVMFDRSYAPGWCYGGKFNVTQSVNYNHKEWHIRMRPSTSATNSIFSQIETIITPPSQAKDCTRLARTGLRFEAIEAPGVNDKQQPSELSNGTTCSNSVVEAGYDFRINTKYRYWVRTVLNLLGNDSRFDAYETCAGVTLDPTETFHLMTVIVWGEWDTTPTRLIYNYPIRRYKSAGASPTIFSAIDRFNFESDTSADEGILLGDASLRQSDFVMLKNRAVSDETNLEADTTVFKRPRR